MREDNTVPVGYRQQSFTTAAAITNIPAGARYVLIQPEADIRWRDDGTNPTAAIGMPIPADGSLWYNGADLGALDIISVSGTAVVNFAFYS